MKKQVTDENGKKYMVEERCLEEKAGWSEWVLLRSSAWAKVGIDDNGHRRADRLRVSVGDCFSELTAPEFRCLADYCKRAAIYLDKKANGQEA